MSFVNGCGGNQRACTNNNPCYNWSIQMEMKLRPTIYSLSIYKGDIDQVSFKRISISFLYYYTSCPYSQVTKPFCKLSKYVYVVGHLYIYSPC